VPPKGVHAIALYPASVSDTCDIAIIGAGAAGLAAAIYAAEADRRARVVLLDGAKKVGAKILVAGGGRCNVTHDHVTSDDFNGSRTFVRHVLAAFNEKDAVKWFAALGVELKREDTGKLFPVTDSARTVLDALLHRCAELRIELREEHRVNRIDPEPRTPNPEPRFLISHSQGTLAARRVIMATGGKSLPLTGSDGGGWSIVQSLGHTVTPTYPALVPLVLEPSFFHAAISGLSLDVELSTFAHGKLADRRTGSLLWTHFGISGPVVMDASRHWTLAAATGAKPRMTCSFLPGLDFAAAEKLILDHAQRHAKRLLAPSLGALLPQRLVDVLLRHARIDGEVPLNQLSRDDRRSLVHALTALELPVLRDRGWNYAEVTAGGVPLNEVHHRDMQSRRVPGLFLVGEMLDCDGRIGGFNFQWAWSTGYLAGRAAAAV